MPPRHAQTPNAEDFAADRPSLPATLTVGVATLLSAIAFAVSAFISVTGESQALPAGEVVASPADGGSAANGLDLDFEFVQPARTVSPDSFPAGCLPAASLSAESLPAGLTFERAFRLQDTTEFDEAVLRLAPSDGADPASAGVCPLVPVQVAPAGDRVRQLRVHIVERTTAPA